MKKIFFAIAAVMVAGAAFAQGKTYNDPNAEVRNVKTFTLLKYQPASIFI